ncbi:hypothetical protein INT47_006588 [Mucor saturninus]|uniref:Uncharacterized protein n=1 Tax=Mucor saturninus TaxID=64648 RepID=A0A8H7QHI0_9FUNG|nr:hypothetical protein INT47_006588 [Mucor saturninus]
MRDDYGLSARYLPLFAYLESTWSPLKEHFVNPWINKYLHLGVISTSRVEGAHNKLKRRLKVSTSHLDKVANLVKSTVEVDASEFKARLEDQKLKVITEVEKRRIMTRVIRRVSLYALSEALEQVKKNEECSLDDQHQVLQVDDFHQQWRLEYSPSSEQLEELDPESNLDYLVDLLSTRFRNAARYEQEEMSYKTMPGQEEDLPVLLREEMTLRQTEEIPPVLIMQKEEQGFVELVDSRNMTHDNVPKESCPKLLALLNNLSNSNNHNDHLDRLF